MLRPVMANSHATLTTFSCPQLVLASPDVVLSFFRQFHALEMVTLENRFISEKIYPLAGTTSLAIFLDLNSVPALRELSLSVDAVGITRTLLMLNALRTLNSLALHVKGIPESEKSLVDGLQAFCCCSPPLETLLLALPSNVVFDLTAMEFVPSLQHLTLTGALLPAQSGAGTGACAVRNRTLRTLSLTKCKLEGKDVSFVYHLEGLVKIELNENESEVLLTNKPAWGDLLLRKVRVVIGSLEGILEWSRPWCRSRVLRSLRDPPLQWPYNALPCVPTVATFGMPRKIHSGLASTCAPPAKEIRGDWTGPQQGSPDECLCRTAERRWNPLLSAVRRGPSWKKEWGSPGGPHGKERWG